MTPEVIAINALTAKTTEYLDVTLALQAGVSQKIADAVAVSTNAAIIPLANMASRLLDMQTLLVTLIQRR